MNMEALIAQIPDLQQQMIQERRAGREALERADHLERVIRSLKALAGEPIRDRPTVFGETDDPTDDASDVHLTGIAAVREVMRESEGRPMRSRDVQAVLERRKWVSEGNQAPIRSTEVALHRMARRGEVERVGRGVFRWRAETEVSVEE